MTARQIFEATLIELSKIQAPALKLYEFNYLFNKAINQYINKVYNVYDINQQTTDDLRVLKSTAYLKPHKYGVTKSGEVKPYNNYTGDGTNPEYSGKSPSTDIQYAKASSYLSNVHSQIQSLNGATYEVFMPIDYLHMLNCVCIYYVAKQKDCWDAGSYIQIPATRLTADSWSQIVTDIYNRPSPMRPYYYIHNQASSITIPTSPVTGNGTPSDTNPAGYTGTDMPARPYKVTDNGINANGDTTDSGKVSTDKDKQSSNFQRTFKLSQPLDGGEKLEQTISLVEKPTAVRVANPSNVRCEIRYGKDDSLFQLVEVQIDYVKSPQFIRLTQEQIDLTEDTSQIMEFPDYVNQEIINELVHLVMEHSNDPRLANNIQMTNTIARPTGQQQAAPQQQAAQQQ